MLGGSGLAWQRTAMGTRRSKPGQATAVHVAGEEAHTLVAGPDGLDVLAFGVGPYPPLTYFVDIDGRHQWNLESALPEPELPPPSPRPSRIVNLDEVEPESDDRGSFGETWHALGRAAGSVRAGLNYDVARPGKLNCPLHCHSAEEELFVVLDGEGVCLLGDDEHPVRCGYVIARPPGTRIAHAFRGGDNGLTLLAYGTREPNDIAYTRAQTRSASAASG